MAVTAGTYGTRLDSQPATGSGTVDRVPDFVNLYDYDHQGSLVPVR